MRLNKRKILKSLFAASFLMLLFFAPAGYILAQTTVVEPPKLNISIPGFQFSDSIPTTEGKISIPWLAQYISVIYEYLIGASTVAAAIMIMYGGFLYIVGSSISSAAKGKEYIRDAIIGLLLVIGSYTVLSTINSTLIVLAPLEVTVVKKSPGQGWLDEQGTLPNTPEAARTLERATAPSPGGVTPPPSQPTLGPVDLSTIPFDKKLGGPENLNQIYAWGRQNYKPTNTYTAKEQALATVIMAWHRVCVKNGLCAYCQQCYTSIPDGKITGIAQPDFALQVMTNMRLNTPESYFEEKPECLKAYKKNPPSIRNMPECDLGALKGFYQTVIIDRLVENKIFGSDCGGLTHRVYGSLGVPFSKAVYKKGNYVSSKDIEEAKKWPTTIYAGFMDTAFQEIAAKGGLKFGDLMFIANGKGSGQHWFLYTGGRTDVPFSFLEMGGGSVSIPKMGTVAGVKDSPSTQTFENYLQDKTEGTIIRYYPSRKPILDAQGNPKRTKSNYDPKISILFVYRPLAYQGD